MADKVSNEAIGFLSVLSRPDYGFFGGLLLVNTLGRPLEFHCTLPVKPTRAQEILYGPTLESFLCGEHIGLALVNKLKSACPILFTDQPSVLGLRFVAQQPVVCITTEKSSFDKLDNLERFEVDGVEAAVLSQFRSDAAKAMDLWKKLAANVQIQEPFGRIHDALMEANPVAAKAA